MKSKPLKAAGLMMVGGVALMSHVRGADAKISTSGTVCNPFNAGEANDTDYVPSGVRNKATSSRQVICAVPRHDLSGAASVTVSGTNTGANTTSITLYSYDSLGNLKASISNTGGPGLYLFGINLTAVQAPSDARLALLVTLPASFGGTFFGTRSDQ
ncbi:MAG TPA: hypothetical protein VJT73_03810 [Polyangiaceae bacterium]|nr:hypothetical protein [Polyangiaceae bacterium]